MPTWAIAPVQDAKRAIPPLTAWKFTQCLTLAAATSSRTIVDRPKCANFIEFRPVPISEGMRATAGGNRKDA